MDLSVFLTDRLNDDDNPKITWNTTEHNHKIRICDILIPVFNNTAQST